MSLVGALAPEQLPAWSDHFLNPELPASCNDCDDKKYTFKNNFKYSKMAGKAK
jgi:hypothetical protein